MKKYFSYIRVSTVRQGQKGVSLPEQREMITRYATGKSLQISTWFVEMETAAKKGRRVFGQMLERLRAGEAAGVIVHKIDRSARNYRDMGDIDELVDAGFEVHIAHDNLVLNSRGSRLYADIQAVVAVDYIRNLREEARKGYYGRLKQGITPYPAPLGYLDAGAGNPKTVDPVRAPMIQEAFARYATGSVSLRALTRQLQQAGLTTRKNKSVTINVVNRILANPYYTGTIRIRKTGEFFAGKHEPLISNDLFQRVQLVLSGKCTRTSPGNFRSFLFSRIIRCRQCDRSLVAEVHKGHTYYRCHSQTCAGTCLREDLIDSRIRSEISRLRMSAAEEGALDDACRAHKQELLTGAEGTIRSLELFIARITEKIKRVTDVFLDGAIDREEFQKRKTALEEERRGCEEKIRSLQVDPAQHVAALDRFVELAKNACLAYETGISAKKREIVLAVMSNLVAERKTLDFTWNFPFSEMSARAGVPSGGAHRDTCRTFWVRLLNGIVRDSDGARPGLRPSADFEVPSAA